MACQIRRIESGGAVFVLSRPSKPMRCAECLAMADHWCDFPVGPGKACDEAMCEKHRNNRGPGVDYCSKHVGQRPAL